MAEVTLMLAHRRRALARAPFNEVLNAEIRAGAASAELWAEDHMATGAPRRILLGEAKRADLDGLIPFRTILADAQGLHSYNSDRSKAGQEQLLKRLLVALGVFEKLGRGAVTAQIEDRIAAAANAGYVYDYSRAETERGALHGADYTGDSVDAMAPLFRLDANGRSFVVGADKIGHFFQQGFDLLRVYLDIEHNPAYRARLDGLGRLFARKWAYYSEGDVLPSADVEKYLAAIDADRFPLTDLRAEAAAAGVTLAAHVEGLLQAYYDDSKGFGRDLVASLGAVQASRGLLSALGQFDRGQKRPLAAALRNVVGLQREGIYGRVTTGVISRADIEANLRGFDFYLRVLEDPGFLRDLDVAELVDVARLDEGVNPSLVTQEALGSMAAGIKRQHADAFAGFDVPSADYHGPFVDLGYGTPGVMARGGYRAIWRSDPFALGLGLSAGYEDEHGDLGLSVAASTLVLDRDLTLRGTAELEFSSDIALAWDLSLGYEFSLAGFNVGPIVYVGTHGYGGGLQVSFLMPTARRRERARAIGAASAGTGSPADARLVETMRDYMSPVDVDDR